MQDIPAVYGSTPIEDLLRAEAERCQGNDESLKAKNYYLAGLFMIYAKESIPCTLSDNELEFPCSYHRLSDYLLKSCYQHWADSSIHKAYQYARIYNLCIHEHDVDSSKLFSKIGRRVMDKQLSISGLEEALTHHPTSAKILSTLVKTNEYFKDWSGVLYWSDRSLTTIKVTQNLKDDIIKAKMQAYASLGLLSNTSKLLCDYMKQKQRLYNVNKRIKAMEGSSKIIPATVPNVSPNISLLFDNDGSMFMSKSFHSNLCDMGVDNEKIEFIHITYQGSSRLSDRQLELLDFPFTTIDIEDIKSSKAAFLIFKDKTHIFSSKAFPFHKKFLRSSCRPSICYMYMGIEFSPIKGLINRLHADAIAFNSQYELDLFEEVMPMEYKNLYTTFAYCPKYLNTRLGLRKSQLDSKSGGGLRIYFLAQAIVPESRKARLELIQLLIDLANKYPNHEIIIKLRHLKGENNAHSHFESSSYESLLEKKGLLPSNLSVSAEPMEQALKSADICITCSSTAGVETALAGIPTFFYLSYEGASTESLYAGAYNLLKESNLLANREQILSLDIPDCSEIWANKFQPNIHELRKYLQIADSQ